MKPTTGKYYIAETYEECLHNASIVRKDNEMILQEEGFTALRFHHIKAGSVVIKLRRLNELIKLALSVKKGDTVIFHFPLLANAYKLLLGLLNKKGVKTIALIIDIDGLRYNDAELLKKELKTLKLFSNIIAHNASMKSFLSQHINGSSISCMELFDYQFSGKAAGQSLSTIVCFAGNFEKAPFVNKLHTIKGLIFNLYGPDYSGENRQNVFYKGAFSSRQLPLHLHGSFGLVWDGNSLETCDMYLKYNTPHKVSLYLSAGIPLIVWDKSALADFVKENQVGILISDLVSLEKIIAQITPDHYALMKNNLEQFQLKINIGFYLRKALKDIQ